MGIYMRDANIVSLHRQAGLDAKGNSLTDGFCDAQKNLFQD